jgi:DNA polymerase III gamma/tau subunit
MLEPTPAAVATPVRRFADILGQRNAVEGLQRRVRTGDHSTGVILYGPEGVGKRTLARLYARAILCAAPSLEEAPCNGCAACRDFEMGSLGYVELDVRDGRGAERARELITIARSQSWTDRRVITVVNADAYAPDAFDVLLKTLEETPSATTFVLLARDLKSVRLAGQSRCVVYRLRPLEPQAARQHARSLCEAHGVDCDEQVLDLLAAVSEGLLGRLRHLAAGLAGRGELTVEGVQRVLGLDWVGKVAAYWRTVLASKEPAAMLAASVSGAESEETIRRARALLHHVYLRGIKQPHVQGATDPVLLCADQTVVNELAAMFQSRAKARGVSAERLWHELAGESLHCF